MPFPAKAIASPILPPADRGKTVLKNMSLLTIKGRDAILLEMSNDKVN
jgi:hypothetical protein